MKLWQQIIKGHEPLRLLGRREYGRRYDCLMYVWQLRKGIWSILIYRLPFTHNLVKEFSCSGLRFKLKHLWWKYWLFRIISFYFVATFKLQISFPCISPSSRRSISLLWWSYLQSQPHLLWLLPPAPSYPAAPSPNRQTQVISIQLRVGRPNRAYDIQTLSWIVRSNSALRSISTTSILARSAAMCRAVWDLWHQHRSIHT